MKSKKPIHFKALCCVFLLLVILQVGVVSAWDFDNVKEYNEDSKVIDIYNCDLWIGICLNKGERLARIQLISDLKVNVFDRGSGIYQQIALLKFHDFVDDTGALQKISTYDVLGGMIPINRNIKMKYRINAEDKQIPIYEQECIGDNSTRTCKTILTGYRTEEQFDWVEFTELSELPKQNIFIGLYVDVQPGEKVEWIPDKWFGETIGEWAVWTEGLTEITQHYYAFDENTGTNVRDELFFNQKNLTVGGTHWSGLNKINTSYFAGGDESIDMGFNIGNFSNVSGMTIAFWMNSSTTMANCALLGNKVNNENGRINFDVAQSTPKYKWTVSDAIGDKYGVFIPGVINDTLWHHFLIMINASEARTYVDGANTDQKNLTGMDFSQLGEEFELFQIDINSQCDNQAIDELAFFNRTLTDSEVSDLYNGGTGIQYNGFLVPSSGIINVELLSPIDNLETIDSTLFFQANFTMGNNMNLTNATLFVWKPDLSLFGINFTIVTGNYTNSTNVSLSGISVGNGYKWNYEACGINDSSDTSCFFASANRTFKITAFSEVASSFNININETSLQFFELNITTIPSILSVTAVLNYNGTRMLGTATCSGSNCALTKTIDIPLVIPSLESQNKTFLWEISVFDGSTVSSFNSTLSEQNVSKIHLEKCNATSFKVRTLNFSAFDEQNLSRIDPFQFDSTFNFWLGSGSVKRNNSFSYNLTEINLCFSRNLSRNTSAIINYNQASNVSSIYTSRFYYFEDDSIDSTLQHIPLFLLKSTESTSFILKVQDENLLPVRDALIEIHRYYPGTDEFRIVQIAKTDDNGKSVGFFETETVDYKFIIRNGTSVLLETGLQKVIPETSPFTLTFNTGGNLGEPWKTQNEIPKLNSTLIWNSDTGIVTYVYVDTSTSFTQGRLLVQLESLTNSSAYVTICNDTLALSSGTLNCNVGNSSGFYIAGGYITRGSEALDLQISFNIETFSSAVGILGLFFGWFVILVAAFMFKFNEVAGIWAVTITVFLVNLMGLIKFGAVFVSAIIGIALILTWVMER